MASGFFGLLAQGASFSGRADVADFKKKQKRAKSGACAAERSPTGEKRPRIALTSLPTLDYCSCVSLSLCLHRGHSADDHDARAG
jgi:hypothetical protein